MPSADVPGCGKAMGGQDAREGTGGAKADAETAQWLAGLDGSGPGRELAVARLHGLLLQARARGGLSTAGGLVAVQLRR